MALKRNRTRGCLNIEWEFELGKGSGARGVRGGGQSKGGGVGWWTAVMISCSQWRISFENKIHYWIVTTKMYTMVALFLAKLSSRFPSSCHQVEDHDFLPSLRWLRSLIALAPSPRLIHRCSFFIYIYIYIINVKFNRFILILVKLHWISSWIDHYDYQPSTKV